VANSDGAFLVTPEALIQLVEDPVEVAIDDGRGGLVFQRPWRLDYPLDPASTIIYLLENDALDPRELLVPTDDQFLTLYDVADGGVWYTRREGDTPETARETLRHYDLETKEVEEVAVTGGWESGAIDVSIGDETIATYWSGEAHRGFDFYDIGGSRIDLAADPYLQGRLTCVDGRLYDDQGVEHDTPCPEYSAVGDNGTLAYLEVGADSGSYRAVLVVVELATGAELVRLDLERPDQGWAPGSLEINDGLVLVNRTRSGQFDAPFIEALIIEVGTGARIEAGLAGRARFLTAG
jgi:hypothetical protein